MKGCHLSRGALGPGTLPRLAQGPPQNRNAGSLCLPKFRITMHLPGDPYGGAQSVDMRRSFRVVCQKVT